VSLAAVTTAASVLSRYRPELVEAGAIVAAEAQPARGFEPGPELLQAGPAFDALSEGCDLAAVRLGDYRGRSITLLDLMRDPATRTTKTFASRLIVGRAIRHIQRTGERVLLVSPSSGNKATALRAAVQLAVERSLVEPDRLQTAVVVPRASVGKLWSSGLAERSDLAQRNPVFVSSAADPESVKGIARSFADGWGPRSLAETGVRVWHTMALDNYRVADAVRACFEAEAFPPGERGRVHAHAVSSGFGLLGYDLGRRVLARGSGEGGGEASFLLVQHLRTPDLVLAVRRGGGPSAPAYRRDPSGRFVQGEDPTFPAVADTPDEQLDATFYTRRPATTEAVSELLARGGGGGIVVSGAECLARYQEIGALLQPAGVALPADPGDLREWALVMAMTGVLLAADRGLLPRDAEVVVHGSGSYAVDDYRPLEPAATIPAEAPKDMAEPILRALRGEG
jgi:hypothetical protein